MSERWVYKHNLGANYNKAFLRKRADMQGVFSPSGKEIWERRRERERNKKVVLSGKDRK